ncbi:MAG: CAP domain-containing protein [Bacteroidota bacterium]
MLVTLLMSTGILLAGCTSSHHTAALDHLLGPVAWDASRLAPPPPIIPAVLEQALHEAVNTVRQEQGYPPLQWTPALRDVAAEHSYHMAEAPFFGHTNPQGENPSDRAARHGLTPTRPLGPYVLEGIGENLYLTHRYREVRLFPGDQPHEADWKTVGAIADETIRAWLGSATHRANLLSPHYRGHAIGVVIGQNHTVYITQNFSPCDVTTVAEAR